MLDYDGTLVTFAPEPRLAPPDPEILNLLKALSKHADVVLLTGREKKNLDENAVRCATKEIIAFIFVGFFAFMVLVYYICMSCVQ